MLTFALPPTPTSAFDVTATSKWMPAIWWFPERRHEGEGALVASLGLHDRRVRLSDPLGDLEERLLDECR